jgi:phosphatidylserine/phosphatidylglycerophosphate/cardiolipin synthase-like enzyme
LKDASENYPAWLNAIGGARQTIDFEMYIIHEDDQGQLFADALLRKAAEGVQSSRVVRLDGRLPEDIGAILESPAVPAASPSAATIRPGSTIRLPGSVAIIARRSRSTARLRSSQVFA